MHDLRAGLLTALLVVVPTTAFAHAHLTDSNPAQGASVATADEVSLHFSEALERNFSSVEVRSADGRRVDDGKLRTDQDQAGLAVGLTKLAPGRYQVIWHATSVDTHRTEGRFSFTVTQ